MDSITTHINNLNVEVFKFKYLSGVVNGEDYFVLVDGFEVPEKKCNIGQIIILIPSWVEMQDLYQLSAEKDIQTLKYKINVELLKKNKLKLLCLKLIDHKGNVYLLEEDLIRNMYPSLADFIVNKIDSVITKYYFGSGLTPERERALAYDCYKYFSAIEKAKRGDEKIVIPPCPGIIMLVQVCEMFDCTPDIARKIPKRDIDMILIAKEQESICKNHPDWIGFD